MENINSNKKKSKRFIVVLCIEMTRLIYLNIIIKRTEIEFYCIYFYLLKK